MNECLFCKIVKGELPAEIVYEDDKTLAFLDIGPNNPGHVLVIPKAHHENFMTAGGEVLRDLISVIPKIAQAVMDGLDYKGFNLDTNNGAVAGQEVPHFHFHIIPRKEGDGHKFWEKKPYAEGEMAEVAQKIKAAL